MLKVISNLAIVSILSLLFFMILPFRFEHETMNCAGGRSSCDGYSITEATSHSWYWFGGYHAVFEPRSSNMYQRESRSSQYQYGSRLELALWALLSVGLGITSYMVVSLIFKKKQQ